jgi:SAM-dependent methyltransferase
LYDILPDEIKTNKLYALIKAYLFKYVDYNDITVEEVDDCYSNYIKMYNRHCKEFIKTEKYPMENGFNDYSISREKYDIVLLLSVLFTPHRFRIMQLLYENNPSYVENALFIGLGPGLELSLTKDKLKNIDTYDLSANKFLFSEFSDISINKEYYTGQQKEFYNAIYMIELLEHVEDPYNLLQICYNSLGKGGKLCLTTATDIPQFDHYFNFPFNHCLFEEKIHLMGFIILKKEVIMHNYLTLDIKPSNHFYFLEKI